MPDLKRLSLLNRKAKAKAKALQKAKAKARIQAKRLFFLALIDCPLGQEPLPLIKPFACDGYKQKGPDRIESKPLKGLSKNR